VGLSHCVSFMLSHCCLLPPLLSSDPCSAMLPCPQAATGAITHHLAYQAQDVLQSLGLSAGSSSSRTGGEKKKTPFENLSSNAAAELQSRLQEALTVYSRCVEACVGVLIGIAADFSCNVRARPALRLFSPHKKHAHWSVAALLCADILHRQCQSKHCTKGKHCVSTAC
jgi:hypothetical protein